jgi:chemotaxis protein MotA
MFAIIGIVVVFGAVVAGYLMEHGHLGVLVQPAELLIIGGAGGGTLLIANPVRTLKKILGGAAGVFGSSKFGKARYLTTLKMMYDLLQKARRGGMLTIEGDVEKPEESPVFQPYPEFIKNHHLKDFVCDTMRMVITGGVDAFDMDQMMDLDMEVQHHGEEEPVTALATMADSLPGLGIVAAVLGVVITMGALGGAGGRDWAQGGGGAGGDVSGDSAVLRAGRSGGPEHGEVDGGGACVSVCTAGADAGVYPRTAAGGGH